MFRNKFLKAQEKYGSRTLWKVNNGVTLSKNKKYLRKVKKGLLVQHFMRITTIENKLPYLYTKTCYKR